MPLSEFLKMLKNESGEKKPTSSSQDLSSLPGSDFAELVWENGPVTMASKTKKSVGNASSSRNWKLDLASSVLDEMPSSVPNGEMDLRQDDEIAPWLNYSPTNNAQPQEYGSQLLPEMSGMTANEPSGHNGFALIDKGVSPNNPIVGSSNRNGPKLDASSRFGLLASWSSQQANPLVSGVSDIISSNGSINLDSVPGQASTKIQKRETQTLLNFSNFSRPVVLAGIEAKRKREKEVKENSQNRAKTALVEARSISKNENDLKSLEQTDASFREGGPNDAKHISPVYVGRVSEGEKAVEHGACSSVCSGSSAERASNDLSHSLKRRNRESEESGCPSEDDESAGAKKAGPARGGTGQKRSRAAEVHNLSERRRRDRINEKMRALQELIPNCNKADKASMLDEAIEYLKTLQLQLQIMSMGAGLCMPQMMFPAGMHHHMQHFPQMGLGIGMGMGMGFGMGLPIPPMPRPPPHFSSPGGPIAFGHPSPMSVPRTLFVPFSYPPPSPGLNAPRMGMNGEVPSKNLQPRQNADPTQAETTSDQPPNASDDPTVNATNSTNVAGSK